MVEPTHFAADGTRHYGQGDDPTHCLSCNPALMDSFPTEIHVFDWPVESDFQDSYAYDLANSAETWHPDFAASAYREQCQYSVSYQWNRGAPKVVPVAMTYRWERRPIDHATDYSEQRPADIMATTDDSWADF